MESEALGRLREDLDPWRAARGVPGASAARLSFGVGIAGLTEASRVLPHSGGLGNGVCNTGREG